LVNVPDEDRGEWVNDPAFAGKIGVLIPCHKSAEEIARTVQSCMRHVRAEHIVVIDNANQPTSPDNTEAVVRAVDERVKYLYVPRGHKTNALWAGLQELPKECTYVMHIDDDTELPEHFVLDESHFYDPLVSAVSYGITMYHSNDVERSVDFEFKLFSMWRGVQDALQTVWFCHGIIGIWRRDRFYELMFDHPFLPCVTAPPLPLLLLVPLPLLRGTTASLLLHYSSS
jgi:hypothetical protein